MPDGAEADNEWVVFILWYGMKVLRPGYNYASYICLLHVNDCATHSL